MIQLIPPFRNIRLKKTVEPLSNYVTQQKLDELKAVMDNPALSQYQKDMMRRHISGSCHSCGGMPDRVLKYKMHGVTVIERYCDECLNTVQES